VLALMKKAWPSPANARVSGKAPPLMVSLRLIAKNRPASGRPAKPITHETGAGPAGASIRLPRFRLDPRISPWKQQPQENDPWCDYAARHPLVAWPWPGRPTPARARPGSRSASRSKLASSRLATIPATSTARPAVYSAVKQGKSPPCQCQGLQSTNGHCDTGQQKEADWRNCFIHQEQGEQNGPRPVNKRTGSPGFKKMGTGVFPPGYPPTNQ